MFDIISFVFDLVLIGLLGAAISFAMKLTRQLADMRASRAEMERLVLAFNATVTRAEAGIQGLKSISRETGDDLENLIQKGQDLRDELMFLTESADQIATRLSQSATLATQQKAAARTAPQQTVKKDNGADIASLSQKTTQTASTKAALSPASAAEKELLRVLKKLG